MTILFTRRGSSPCVRNVDDADFPFSTLHLSQNNQARMVWTPSMIATPLLSAANPNDLCSLSVAHFDRFALTEKFPSWVTQPPLTAV
jgi:hypothetical protein